jgi:hypothetical protein
MQNSNYVTRVLVLIIVLLTAALLWLVVYKPSCPTVDVEENENLIGVQTDEHGCLVPAGYSWDEEVGACLRVWEVDGVDARAAAVSAVNKLGRSKGLTLISVQAKDCSGLCFDVEFEVGDAQPKEHKVLLVEGGEVTEVSMTKSECEKISGAVINVLSGATCASGEDLIGDVSGLVMPSACCVPKTNEVVD